MMVRPTWPSFLEAVMQCRRRVAQAALTLLMLSSPIAVPMAQELVNELPDGARLYRSACPSDDIAALGGLCYRLEVAENRSKAGGRSVKVPIVVFPGSSRQERPDPVFWFQGGPSYGITASYKGILGFKDAFDGRDIVLTEFRGGPKAEPALQCPDENYVYSEVVAKGPGTGDKVKLWSDFLSKCYKTLLQENIDPNQYNDYTQAFDTDDVRKLLKYDKINVGGGSAGGGTAMAYLKYFPDHVRAVVLDSAWLNSLKYRPMLTELQGWRLTYEDLADRCKLDAACARAFPTFAFDLNRARAALDAHPWTFVITDRTTGKPREIVFEGMDLEWLVYHFLFDDKYNQLPALFDDIIKGRPESLAKAVDFQKMFSSPYYFRSPPEVRAFGHYWASTCGNAGAAKLTTDDALAMIAAEPALLLWERPLTMCAWWPGQGDVPASLAAPVVSDKPVLLLTGQVDACCSTRWADHAMRYLSAAQSVEAPWTGHGPLSYASPCLLAITRQYLRQPNGPVDKRCLADFKQKGWQVQ
ncbi:TAP-like protein [Chelatococcus asaccharovorans]|nr:TAP-like protein [Chelatococcus asaccharovorans]CAH1681666.1 TAP-like protein [Chelatococcus asaccharovorans]